MNAVLPKSPPPTLPDTRSATSSPALAAGVSPSDLPAGQTLDLFGRVVAPVSPLAGPGKAKAGVTIDTSGRIGRGSSASVALSRFLANRLKARLPTAGSTLFQMTWNEKVTPSGRHVSLLRVSGHRTGGNGSGSWPTPRTMDTIEESPEHWAERNSIAKAKNPNLGAVQKPLSTVAHLATWPTPDATNQSAHLQHPERPDGGQPNLAYSAQLASWPTTRAEDSESTGAHRGKPDTLTSASRLTSWGTPTSQDSRHATVSPSELSRDPANLRIQAHGLTSSGFPAETASSGQLNPAFSRWLQGYPVAWCQAAIRVKRTLTPRRKRESGACAATVTPSSRKSRPK